MKMVNSETSRGIQTPAGARSVGGTNQGKKKFDRPHSGWPDMHQPRLREKRPQLSNSGSPSAISAQLPGSGTRATPVTLIA